jgi:hypothetical protein
MCTLENSSRRYERCHFKKDDIIEEASVKGKGTGVNGDIKNH